MTDHSQPRINILFKRFTRFLQLPFFDQNCRVCECALVHFDESVICRDCKSEIRPYPHPACPLCARPMSEPHEACGECLVLPPPFRKHVSYTAYQEQFRDLILAYKYSGMQKIRNLLVTYYIELFNTQLREPGVPPSETFDYIVPMPPDRSRKRDFDPILSMAKKVSRHLKIPLMSGNLIKIKKTKPQASLTRAKRLVNLDGAFALEKPERIN